MQYRSKTTLLKAFFHTINFNPLFGVETERTPRDAKQVPFVDREWEGSAAMSPTFLTSEPHYLQS